MSNSGAAPQGIEQETAARPHRSHLHRLFPAKAHLYVSASEEAHPLAQPAAGRPIRGRLRRLELLVVAAIVGFAWFAWQTHTEEQALHEAAAKQDKALTDLGDGVRHQAGMIDKVIQSFADTTKDLTAQLGSLSGNLQRRQNQMETIQSRLRRVESTMRNSQQARSLPPPPANQLAAAPVSQAAANPAIAAPALAAPTPPASSDASAPAPRHNVFVHPIDMSIGLPPGALAHQNSQHEIDYWMVSRMVESVERTVKVQPYATNEFGIDVHCLDDGKDYILTPQGTWLPTFDQR